MDTDTPLVIPLKEGRVIGLTWNVFGPLAFFGIVALIAFDWSWTTLFYAGLGLFALGTIWASRWAGARSSGSAPKQIVVTRETIGSRTWRLDWDRVDCVSVGRVPGTRQRALRIEPHRREDVRRPPSRVLGFLAGLGSLFGDQGVIQIPECLLDAPLDEVIDRLESKAGRKLVR